ncbi:glycosyltransferase family 2 protein [Patescibacteria group bacterium]|nr:glycosyltransferase family 2 protein [Patescibacteria group bacterium]
MFNKQAAPALTISLVTHNGQRWLPYCLAAVANQIYQDFFFLIIDNGSLDNTVAIIKDFLIKNPEFKNRSRLIQHKNNIGFARAHNQAIAWTDSKYILLLNQDVKLSKFYLATLIKQMAKQPTVAAASGKLIRWVLSAAEGGLEASTTLGAEYLDSAGLVIKKTRRVMERGGGQPDTGQYDKASLVFGISGAAPIYKRSALLAVASDWEILDEDFFSYKEDVDLAWRLQRAGYEAFYLPEAVAYHDRSLVLSDSWRNYRLTRRQRAPVWRIYSWSNHLFVLLKNDGWFNLLRDLPWWLGYELAKFFYMLLFEPILLKKAVSRFFYLLPTILRKRKILRQSWQRPSGQLRRWWLK